MKTKLISAILIGAAAFSMVSCHGDLNVKQPGAFTAVSMWENESDAESALNGAYAQMRATFSELLLTYGEMRTNLYCSGAVNSADYNNIGKNQLTSGNAWSNWASLYTLINDANLIIKHAPDIKFSSDAKRNQVVASALFIRAYTYYTIARVWGDAPLLVKGIESAGQDDVFPTRGPAADIFAQVEADVEEAIKIMPTTATDPYKVTPAAINMLRADYYTWKASRLGGGKTALQSAQSAINAVIGDSKYDLLPDFANVFSTKKNKEIIFAFLYKVGEVPSAATSNSHNIYCLMLAPLSDRNSLRTEGYTEDQVPTGSHAHYYTVTEEYYDFLADDARVTASVRDYRDDEAIYTKRNIKRMIIKFKGRIATDGTRVFDDDQPVYRLAEAYLLKAEIENALGNTQDAVTALNKVAERGSGIANKYSAGDDLVQAIIDENKREFVAEGKMWWVYLRMNKEFEQISTLTGRQNEYQGNILLWPVANACMTSNPGIEQTPGYN